jgi:hypothetical protein
MNTNASEVLLMLCPDEKWTMYDNDFDTIIWENGKPPITKKQFLDGFDKLEAYKNKQNALLEAEIAARATAKSALLTRLGITEDEARLLLG